MRSPSPLHSLPPSRTQTHEQTLPHSHTPASLNPQGERDYAWGCRVQGQHHPDRITHLNMDAPTERQLDVPTQNRKAFDTCKSLEAKKWETHMMGVLHNGTQGMYSFMSRHGLGSGPNLSCTCLYLTLLSVVRSQRALGAHIHVLLDNTTGDNKNNEVLFFLAWLVETNVCEEVCLC